MKKRMLIPLLLGIVLALAPAADAALTFDAGNGGVTPYWINSTGYVWGTGAVFHASGGHPGGYISADVVGGADNRLYCFEVSGSAIGSLTGKTLTVDYRSIGSITGPAGANVRFYIGDAGFANYFVTTDAYAWSADTGGAWTTNSVFMDAANFTAWPNQNAGTMSFAQVAANPGWVGLLFSNGNFSDNDNLGLTSAGGATISLDNFGTPNPVPIPGAALLLGSGLAGLLGLRLRPKK